MQQPQNQGSCTQPARAFSEDCRMASGDGPIDEKDMGADGDGEQDSIGQACADQGRKGIGVEVADRCEIKAVQCSCQPSSLSLMGGEHINAVRQNDCG